MCDVSGCPYPATKFSRLCEKHRNNDRNNGHPLQRSITKQELRPYFGEVQRYLSERSGPNAEAVIRRVWAATIVNAEEFMQAVQRGRPHNVNERKAAEIVLGINREHDAKEVALTCMALGYWYQFEPRRWASDDGFRFQVVRMVRRLAPTEGRFRFRPDGTMVRSSYPRAAKRTVYALWKIISETGFVGWGVAMAKEAERTRQAKRRDTIAETMEILGPMAGAAAGA